jgi:hypothetical protein
MFPSARRRPGTTPSFWRAYHQAQLRIAGSSPKLSPVQAVEPSIAGQLMAEYSKTKRPAAAHFVCVGR